MAATQFTKKDIRVFIAEAMKEHCVHSESWTLGDVDSLEFQKDESRTVGAFDVLMDMANEFGVKVEGLNK